MRAEPPSCRRCGGEARPDREICHLCALRIREAVGGPAALRDLAAYWERRIYEQREKDWT